MDALKSTRPNQKLRTRKDLLQAASRLLRQGRNPSLEEIAEEAMVSRATAYRYFPGVEALLLEASLDVAVPDVRSLFAGTPTDDPLARLDRLEEAFHEMTRSNELQLRLMLMNALRQGASGEQDGATPIRQNRRSTLIDAALAPTRTQFRPEALDRLRKALALLYGTEAMLVFKDVLQLDDAEAREVTRWAIHALVEAARRER
ncbi:TetR/AcrR family transcriptional regulator [Pseudomonas schmalbachii]|uniref:TetR/AcrR family transcriptional regulator n=1 Tax=Pseudomonas schmalbachii TaxID=2816993 RepID=A0ABS3TPA7_9PSED|nr:TetR/AcrR family transcriptional regulator [Pseudomonas schmalbachii]MBO3275500.1 TetR/AcrR family transcriptional regulator [Pseudomonas schmalbachii]